MIDEVSSTYEDIEALILAVPCKYFEDTYATRASKTKLSTVCRLAVGRRDCCLRASVAVGYRVNIIMSS